jgi:DNA-binding NarL/FixJ family response regulator
MVMDAIRVVLADDHGFLRVGVRSLLEEATGIEVVAEASDGQEALALVAAHRPDVLVTDISMPCLDGLELAGRVARDHPETKVLILSMHKEKAYATRALGSGAAGYLLKEAGAAELESAVRAVARGEGYISPAVSAHVVADYARLAQAEASAADPLSPRQREVLCLIAQGLPTKAIARRLGISVKTAETHRGLLMERLDIHDVAGLVRYAIRTGQVGAAD